MANVGGGASLQHSSKVGGGKAPATTTAGKADAEDPWPEEEPKPRQLDEFELMEQEVLQEIEESKMMNGEDGKKKKKRKDVDKKGRKKKRKGESEKENKKAQYENDILAKHVGPRVRSFDAAKMKSKFQKPKESTQIAPECRICGKIVFQMEKIVAEKANWHKNCFRCCECNKSLTLETYQSNDGRLYCKPHFNVLFKPKAVVQDEAEERKERQMRRPKMIVLESKPEALPEDVVRATEKPDYGLDDLQTTNVKQRFAQFEQLSTQEEKPLPPMEPIRRSKSLLSKAARFMEGGDGSYGVDNEEMEEYDEFYEEEEEESEEEEVEGEDGVTIVRSKKKKERPTSFAGMGDLKSGWEQKQRREEMQTARKEEISRFRQMLCAGKNSNLRAMFESGQFEQDEEGQTKESREIVLDAKTRASNLRARFEQGEPFILEEEDDYESGEEGEDGQPRPRRKKRVTVGREQEEVEEVFKEAETAKKARNVFRQIDSKVAQDGVPVMRSASFANNASHRLSADMSYLRGVNSPPATADITRANDPKEEDFEIETTDLANRFKFFATYEERKKKEAEAKKKAFRITPPREATDGKGMSTDESDVWGRDPNLIRCSDKYEDDVDCRNTKNILQMFKKMEMKGDDDREQDGPPPPKCFTPPPDDNNDYGSSEEYTGSYEDYTSDEEDDEDFEDEEEDSERINKPKIKDEILEMSAKRAGQLRAKFEKWEANPNNKEERSFDEGEEECRPSIDTARNLKAMFENKAAEDAKVHISKQSTKIKRFV